MTFNTNKTQSTNMPQNLARKILASHLISGEMNVGEEIAVRVDQTLTHDVTGTQAYLAFETMNIPKVKTELSVSYVDHNLLYADNKNPDDHIYLQTIAKKYGLYLSRACNGICHTVHFERFGRPGMIALGSDSHTPTGSAIGALAIGAGGLDVALAMAGVPLYLKMPINEPLPDTIQAHVSAYRPDNITTDDIIPANAQFSALRSNIPAISQITFSRIDPDFVKRAEGYGKSFIVGGENYGQGSSREHAAIAPMYLGVKAVITKSLARIHKNNLINHGVVPLNFVNLADYDKINQDDELKITNFPEQLKSRNIIVENLTKGFSFETKTELTEREVNILIDGGQLRQVQAKNNT